MSTLWNDALEFFLKHLTHDCSNGPSHFFVDVYVSAGTSNNVESSSKSKLVQYSKAWNQFRHETLPSNPDKYQHLMTRYEQINHARMDQPEVFVYDGYLDSHACDFPVTRRIYICMNVKFSSTRPTPGVNLLPSGCKLIIV